MTITVHELVKVVGAELEAEDRSFDPGGILRIWNERYYQFVACRGLHRCGRDVKSEHRSHDLVIFVEGKPNAFIEMKCWGSANGIRELRGIASDVQQKLMPLASSSTAFMIIFSANPRDQTKQNLAFLEEKIPELAIYEREIYPFPTFDPKIEFWVAGWQIGSRRQQATDENPANKQVYQCCV
jgi:hypothetical protein